MEQSTTETVNKMLCPDHTSHYHNVIGRKERASHDIDFEKVYKEESIRMIVVTFSSKKNDYFDLQTCYLSVISVGKDTIECVDKTGKVFTHYYGQVSAYID